MPQNATTAPPRGPATDRQAYRHLAYRPDIDGMRAIAVLAVLAFHGFPGWVRGGFVGVDVFFVISGYLISGIIFSSMAKAGRFDYAEFYSRRVRRIFPALFLVLAATWATGWFTLFADEFRSLGKHTFAGAFFISNILNWSETGYFDASSETKPLLHLWSLGVEEQFYIVWPIVLIVFARLRPSRFLAVVAALTLASLATGLWQARTDFDASYYLPFARFWELLLGCLLAYRVHTVGPVLAPHRRAVANALSVAGLALVLGAVFLLDREQAVAMAGAWPLLPTLGTCAMIAAGPDAWVNRGLLSNRIAVWFGLVSYPLYLWHWPLLVFSQMLSGGRFLPGLRVAALALAVLLAWLTWRLAESRMRRPAHARAKVAVLCALVGAIGLAGLATYLNDGYGRRAAALSSGISEDFILPLRTRKPDGSCERLLGLRPAPGIVCLANSREPELLVVGDSHAMSFASAALVGRSDVRVLLIAVHSCLEYSRDASEACNRVGDMAADAARRLPSLRTVALANTYGYFRYERDYTRALETLLGKLRASGRRAVLVLDAPKLEDDVHNCLHRQVELAPHDAHRCVIPLREAEDRQAAYRAAVRRLAENDAAAGVALFDSFPSLCDAAYCRGMDDAHVFYFDSNHLSISGSSRVLRDFARIHLPPPAGPAGPVR